MSCPGPPPTPTPVLKMRGSWRAKARKGEPMPTKANAAMRCPAWLDREATAEWRRIVPELKRMNVLAGIDRAALAGYCQMWSLYAKAAQRLQRCDADNLMDMRRLAAIASDAFRNYLRAGAEFGLTPSARSRVRVNQSEKPKDGKARFFQSS